MHWKRSACGLLLGGGLSIFNIGCAALDALVHSPAGHSAQQTSPERIAAIGRVFENQGRYEQAQTMYRRVLTHDPANAVARQRLAYIASMGSNRSFDATGRDHASPIAVADSLNSKNRTSTRQANVAIPKRTQQASEAIESGRESLMASLQPAVVEMTVEKTVATTIAVEESVAYAEGETVNSDVGEIPIASPGWQLDTPAPSDAAEVTLTFAPAAKVADAENSDVTRVGFEGQDDQTATVASLETESAWKPSTRVVTLDEVLEWSNAAADNQENLLTALRSGEDDGVKAYAASLLAECAADDSQVNDALQEACEEGSELIRASAQDALMLRGQITEAGVTELLNLLTSSDAGIRAQAAASLRSCSGTVWSTQSVEGIGQLLADDDTSVVAVAAATLGDFGAEATVFRGDLLNLLSTSFDEYTLAAVELALNRIPAQDVTLQSVESVPEQTGDQTEDAGEYLPVVE